MKRKMQIFVSSTFTDLIVERQAAVSAILKSGHIPAGMELFTAGDKSQWDTIKRWIDQSDAYMLILGGRYGSIDPISNISYTELEYDYASQQGKPLFAVVIKEEALESKVKTFGSAVMEKENPQELTQFRKKVLSNISSFFADEKDIKLCVYESLSDMDANPAISGWIAAAEVEDTKPLHAEIERLKEENAQLKSSQNDRTAHSNIKSPSKAEDFDVNSSIKILEATDVKIPEKLAGKKDAVTNLMTLFDKFRDKFINGITNSAFSSDLDTFLYANVAPKLIVYDLAVNEKVAGVQHRRSFVSANGLKVLAKFDDIKRRKRKKDSKTDGAVGEE